MKYLYSIISPLLFGKNYYKEEKENYETNAAEMEAQKDSFAKVQNDLKEAMTKNESYQEIIKNLQEALAIKKEMENREKHEDKKKNCPQNKVETRLGLQCQTPALSKV